VTPKVIRNLIVAIWVTAGALSLPGYLGFVWPDPATCIATLWPKFETAVEVCLYAVSCTLVVFVYTRIWNEVMHGEVQQQQQQQPNWTAATTNGTTSQSVGRGNEERGIRVFWHNRRLIRKHRATRTIMVILGYRQHLVTSVNCSNYTMHGGQSATHRHGHSGQLRLPLLSVLLVARVRRGRAAVRRTDADGHHVACSAGLRYQRFHLRDRQPRLSTRIQAYYILSCELQRPQCQQHCSSIVTMRLRYTLLIRVEHSCCTQCNQFSDVLDR